MARRRARREPNRDRARLHFEEGYRELRAHPLFAPLTGRCSIWRGERGPCPEDGWAVGDSSGGVYVHPRRLADPGEWQYVLAHCLLHLGFGHFQERERPREWNTACDCVIASFLADLKLGRRPRWEGAQGEVPRGREERLYREYCQGGIPENLQGFGTGGAHASDMILEPPRGYVWMSPSDWQDCLAAGLANAVRGAVDVAAGARDSLVSGASTATVAQRARDWFISSYPLLGALAASFEIVEDAAICGRMGISVAAVDVETREVFINPAAGLNAAECRFVIAHELLHVGLRHDSRCQGRDPFLWNVACDFVINGWLVEMEVGSLPTLGGLHDRSLASLSAEAIYDRMACDLRKHRKLRTLRGVGECDILRRGVPDWGDGATIELDELYRRCLAQGLSYHEEQGRGYLPAGLVEEIRALSQPAIPWDVELAQWFDSFLDPLEMRRSYARPSRRQSATPDIPRPSWVPVPGAEKGRTFGVVLDTSGSMDRAVLAKALGTIASYSVARDVPAVRVVFCDAATYDQGYMSPEEIAGRVKVRGRGGTVIQPSIDLLEKAADFPEKGPLLIITDGYCDRLRVRREHAYLIPRGRHLPFPPRGKVFRIE